MQNLFDDDVFLRDTFNAIPFPTLVVDEDIRILFWNSASRQLLGDEPIFRQKGGEVLHCIHSMETENGCGHSTYCEDCIVRNCVQESIRGEKVYRKKTIMEVIKDGVVSQIPLLATASPYQYKEQKLAVLILEDIRDIVQTGGIVPICASCKKIQTNMKQWVSLERYIKNYIADVEFTHGMCPECMSRYIPEDQKQM